MGPTYHRLSNFVIAIDDDGDTATARTYVHAVLMVTPGDNAAVGRRRSATTTTNWCAVADGWRIRRRIAHTPRILSGGGPGT